MVLICLDKLRLNTAVILSLENVCWSKILKTADKVWWDPLNENSKQNTTKTQNKIRRKLETKRNEKSKQNTTKIQNEKQRKLKIRF